MYRSQRGAVSGALIALIVVGILGAMAVMSYISNANLGNKLEVAIKAKYADNENIYANGTQKVMEIAQVPGMYAADLQKVVTAAIQGRYGPNGSQATMQWIKEAGVSLDPSMYTKIQQVIEAFRNEFQQSQTALLDRCRNYEELRGTVWTGMWLSFAGYPKRDIDKMCTIVSTDKAAKTFETKRDTGIQLRPAN
jgi:uncharacterized protein (UPF0333 family)